jgi:hypothetical protein
VLWLKEWVMVSASRLGVLATQLNVLLLLKSTFQLSKLKMTAIMANANVPLKEDSNLRMDHPLVVSAFTLSTAPTIHMVNTLLLMLRE